RVSRERKSERARPMQFPGLTFSRVRLREVSRGRGGTRTIPCESVRVPHTHRAVKRASSGASISRSRDSGEEPVGRTKVRAVKAGGFAYSRKGSRNKLPP